MIELPRHAVRLDALTVDWGRLHVVRAGEAVRITPKAAAVLHCLLSRPGITLTRRELLDAVWPGTYSSDEVLTQVIVELRRALGDPAKQPRWMVTVPKLGYRWIGPEPVPESAPSSPLAGAPSNDESAPGTGRPGDPTAPGADGNATSTRARAARGRSTPWIALAAIGLSAVALVATVQRWRAPAAPVAVDSRTPRAMAPELAQPRPVSTEPGQHLDPALSRDGTQVAYVHDDGGHASLRVRTLAATRFQEWPLEGDGRPSGPAWSPDGRELAYTWRAGGRCEVRRIELATRRMHVVADGCPVSLDSSVDWSPDGSFLVYSRADPGDGALGGRSISIHRVAPDGSKPMRVSNAHRWLVVDGHARISPDGRELAFVRDGEGRNRVILLALDGSGEEREVPFPRWPYRVAWQAGGTQLLIAAHGRTPGEIWRLRIDGSEAIQLAGPAAGPGLASAREGDALVFEQRTVDDNIWSLDLAEPDATPVQVTRATRSELCPRLSPDGRTLAYLADDNGTVEVTLHDLATGARRRLSGYSPRAPLDLRWSPRGDFLAVVLGTESGKHLAVLGIDGSALAIPRPVAGWRVAQAEWSHDQRWLYATVEQGGRRELRRAAFPSFEGEELVTDESVGAFSMDDDGPGIHFSAARAQALSRLDAGAVRSPYGHLSLRAVPTDQWLVRDGLLAQMRQTERGANAVLSVQRLDGSSEREWRIQAPEPPLGRNLDLRAGRLWYANRDLDTVELVLLPGR